MRDFARATGRLAKTDRLDAQVLAHFAHTCPPTAQEAAAPAAQELEALLVRRAELVVIRAGERSRVTHAVAVVRRQIDAHCRWLDDEITALDAALAAAIAASEDWRAQRALLESVPGVGPVVATTLLALVPELGHLTGKEIGALVGGAPLACESGKRRGRRHIWGGTGGGAGGILYGGRGGATMEPGDQGVCGAIGGGR